MKNIQTLSDYLNEASSAFKHAVQQALKASGYDLKQSEVKVGTKKVRGMGTKITLNGEMIGFDDDIPKMIASFTKSIEEDPEKYGLKESVNEADVMHGEYLMQMLKAQADDLKKQGEPKTAAAMMYLWDRINQSTRDEDIDAEELHNYLNEPRGRKHSQNLPEWMILDLFVESFIMKEDNVNEGSILVWDEMEKPFEDLKNALDKVSLENTDPKWSKALLSIWNQIEKAETNLNNYDRKLGAITTESVNEKKVPPNDETIKFHIDSYRVDDDPYDVAKEIGAHYNWTEREIEKAEKIIRKKYLK